MDGRMVSSIFASASGLFAAVTAAYLATWYGGGAPAQARTVAFVSWLVGHVLLALNLRSARQPLSRLGLVSNRLLLAWGGAASLFALLAVLAPPLHGVLKTAGLSGAQWALAVGAPVAGTFWMEVRKLIAQRAGS